MRTDNDSWSITESVGSSALFAAAARAFEYHKAEPLAVDPFAEPLVRAASGEWAAALDGEGPIFHVLRQSWLGANFQHYQCGRTKYFDAVFAAAAEAGVRQYVILAAGLDARAYRLRFPVGSRVFELDQPLVLEYKARTLLALGAAPAIGRVTVAADLRHDWPAALAEAGFDPAKPTAWLIEGLLMYLSPAAEAELLTKVLSLCAPGSRIGIEHMQPFDLETMVENLRQLTPDLPAESAEAFAQYPELIYNEARPDVAARLTANGWDTDSVPVTELLAKLDRPLAFPERPRDSTAPGSLFTTTTLIAATLHE